MLVLPGKRLVYPCQAALVVAADGVSVSLDCDDGLVGWAEHLGALFEGLQPPEDSDRDASPRCLLSVAACLRDGAVRLDPPGGDPSQPSAAAAVVVREVAWRRLALSSSDHPLVARSCEVFLAAPSVREGSWTPRDAVHVPSLDLTAMGYHRVVSEGKVVVHFGRQIGEPLVRVSGERLTFFVSQTTATLAQRLGEVVSQALAGRAAAAPRSSGNVSRSASVPTDPTRDPFGSGARADSLAALDLARGADLRRGRGSRAPRWRRHHRGGRRRPTGRGCDPMPGERAGPLNVARSSGSGGEGEGKRKEAQRWTARVRRLAPPRRSVFAILDRARHRALSSLPTFAGRPLVLGEGTSGISSAATARYGRGRGTSGRPNRRLATRQGSPFRSPRNAPRDSSSLLAPLFSRSEDGNGAWIEPFVLNESYVARPTETDDAAVPTACVLDCHLNLVVDLAPRDGNKLRLFVSGIHAKVRRGRAREGGRERGRPAALWPPRRSECAAGALVSGRCRWARRIAHRPPTLPSQVNTPSSGDVKHVLRVRCDEMGIEDAFGNPILTRYGDAQLVPQPVLSGAVELIDATGVGLESRISVDCRPLRISLRQQSIGALRSLCSELSVLPEYDEDFGAELVQPLSELPVAVEPPRDAEELDGGAGMFIQRFELSPFMLVLDYLPQRVSVSALRAGNVQELLNIVPFEGVKLRFRHLRVVGIDDPAALGALGGEDRGMHGAQGARLERFTELGGQGSSGAQHQNARVEGRVSLGWEPAGRRAEGTADARSDRGRVALVPLFGEGRHGDPPLLPPFSLPLPFAQASPSRRPICTRCSDRPASFSRGARPSVRCSSC